jgi:hypothetical protein
MLIGIYSVELQIRIPHDEHAALRECLGDYGFTIAIELSLENATNHP